jgi:adenylate kinase family enzyme
MKVYFVGAHSTGKTTCARYVSEKYKLPMITEVARAVLSEKELHLDSLRYDMNLVDDYQTAIFQRQLDEESKYRDFVSDRSFDCLAYAAQHARILSALMKSGELPDYITKLQSPDSFIFFVRPSKATLKADGVRESINWDGVISIDSMVKFMLEMWNLRYFQINIDNMQERIRLIDAVLTLHKS